MSKDKSVSKNKLEDLKMTDKEDSSLEAKKELTREQKKALRRAGMQEQGRLTLSDEIKEKGYRYRVCNVLPGNIENYKSQGYEVVTHPLTSGNGSIQNPEVAGVPHEFEVGGARGSMKAIWMRIKEEDAEILDEINKDKADEQNNMIAKNPVPYESDAANNPLTANTHIGKVTKERLR